MHQLSLQAEAPRLLEILRGLRRDSKGAELGPDAMAIIYHLGSKLWVNSGKWRRRTRSRAVACA